MAPDHRNRNDIGGIAPHLAGGRNTFYRSRRDAEIADDPLTLAHDIGARKSAFVLQGPMTQPVIQCRLTAVERRKIMLGGQRNGS